MATAAPCSSTTTTPIAVLKSLRVHGQGSDKYDNVRIGMNARLDTMQAAVLLEKLAIFADEIAARDRVAARYAEAAAATVAGTRSAGRADQRLGAIHGAAAGGMRPRRRVAARLKAAGSADRDLLREAAAPADRLSRLSGRRQRRCRCRSGSPTEVLSLPMHPYLDARCRSAVAEAVKHAVTG